VAHEFIHGAFFKRYSGRKAKYGFAGLYAYAGSDAYFNKRQYLVIGLSPVILLGIVLLILNVFLPTQFFWGAYLLQVVNLSGAVGDAYYTVVLSRLPADVLVKDEGVRMVIYSRAGE